MVRLEPLYFIGPGTEVQGGSVYPHDPGENLGLPRSSDARGRGGPKNILIAIMDSYDIPHRNIIIVMMFPILMGNLKFNFKAFRSKFSRGPDLDKMRFG